jgi:hypothetical protein
MWYMRHNLIRFLFIVCFSLCLVSFFLLTPGNAYYAPPGNAFGVDPLNPGVDFDLDLDILRLAAVTSYYPGLGLYGGLYGGLGLYGTSLYGGLYGSLYGGLGLYGGLYGSSLYGGLLGLGSYGGLGLYGGLYGFY